MNGRALFGLALILVAVSGCRPDDQRTDSLDPATGERERASYPPGVVAQLDSGSRAFRADDFEAALAHYQRAAELGPDVAAAWFGVFMAHDALGDTAAAREAMRRAQGVAPGASLLHPDGDTLP